MTEDRVLALVTEISNKHGYGMDGFAEEVAQIIIEDNGLDLTDDEVKEIAEQFFDEEI